MTQVTESYYKRDFWAKENLNYAQPHFRMEKVVRIIKPICREKECDLLDVGCGPAALMFLLPGNINYYGIDIAIQRPADNLIQTDFLESPIKFGDKRFDVIVAQGVFEYSGRFQSQKFSEIRQILKDSGKFIVSYVNFDHKNKNIYWPYNNTQPFDRFRGNLEEYFQIDRIVPTSHRWHHDEPRGRLMKAVQMRMNTRIPLISRKFAVEFLFVCSRGR